MCINTSLGRKGVFKYIPGFSGAGEVYLNISLAPDKYNLYDTSPAPEKPGKYLKTPFRPGEVFIHTFMAPEKFLHTLFGAGETGEAGEVFIYTRR